MGSEMSILGLYGLFVIVLILLQVLAAIGQVGMGALAQPREDMPKLTGLAGRLDRAQMNSIIAMALFAPVILILNAQSGFTSSTLLAAQIFLIGRIAYAALYASGTPWLRTLSWMAAFLATAWLYLLAI